MNMDFHGNKLLLCKTKEEFDNLTLEQMEGRNLIYNYMKVKDLMDTLSKVNPELDVVISEYSVINSFSIEAGYIFTNKESQTRSCGEVAKKEIIESLKYELENNISDYSDVKIDKERKKIDEFEKSMKKCLLIVV